MPVVGGPVVLVVAAVVFAVVVGSGAVSAPPDRGVTDLVAGLTAAFVICLVGVVDDWRGLRGRWTLLGQVVAVCIAVAGGVSVNEIQLFEWRLAFGPVRWLITGGILLVAANSLMVLRGMDGLVSSYGMLVSAALGIIGF